jgi:hypothetical protein
VIFNSLAFLVFAAMAVLLFWALRYYLCWLQSSGKMTHLDSMGCLRAGLQLFLNKDYWFDRVHPAGAGARFFSIWLAEKWRVDGVAS